MARALACLVLLAAAAGHTAAEASGNGDLQSTVSGAECFLLQDKEARAALTV